MTLRIAPLTEADRPRWTELWRGYLTFYETVLPDEIYQNTWTRLLAGQELHGLAAWDGDTMLGIVHYLYHPHAWTTGPACYLQDLFVDAAARGKGAGRALIEAVAAKAREAGASRLYWTTQDHNATARALYDTLAQYRGFIKYEYRGL